MRWQANNATHTHKHTGGTAAADKEPHQTGFNEVTSPKEKRERKGGWEEEEKRRTRSHGLMMLISLIRYFNEARPTLKSPAVERRIQTRRLCDFVLPLCKESYFCRVLYAFFSSHIRTHTWKVYNALTSPSEDCKRRSFLQYAVKSPTPALTSTPLGASRVSVRVGDSSLKQTETHAFYCVEKGKVHTNKEGGGGVKNCWKKTQHGLMLLLWLDN